MKKIELISYSDVLAAKKEIALNYISDSKKRIKAKDFYFGLSEKNLRDKIEFYKPILKADVITKELVINEFYKFPTENICLLVPRYNFRLSDYLNGYPIVFVSREDYNLIFPEYTLVMNGNEIENISYIEIN